MTRFQRSLVLPTGLIACLMFVAGGPAVPPSGPSFSLHTTVAAASTGDEPNPPPEGSFTQRYPYLIPRATVDRADDRTGRQIHVVYMVPNGRPDERLDEFGVLHDSMRSINAWMTQRTGLRWRLDTFTFPWDDPVTPEEDPVPAEVVDVTFLRIDRPASELGTWGGRAR